MESNVTTIRNRDPRIDLIHDDIVEVINNHIGRGGMAYATIIGTLELVKTDIIEQYNAE